MRSALRLSASLPLLAFLLLLAPGIRAGEEALEPKPAGAAFARFAPLAAPAPGRLLLQTGDRLAICGDSITEQRMYSRIMETYLAACTPDLRVEVRQYGWSGETAEGFVRRMTNDCLRFRPTIATTCYGMNDHRYQPYQEEVARWYRTNQTTIVDAFQAHGARVVLGSAGCVGKMPGWVKSATGTVEDLNLNLCELRNLNLRLAAEQGVAFADVFWPMFTAGVAGRERCGPDFAIAGKDGVHPDWAGQTVMAYAFLKALGLDGDLGSVTVDLATGHAEATGGHQVERFAEGALTVTSRRYPFCATGPVDQDNSIRAGMALVPFNETLNRFRLVVKGAPAAGCKLAWGGQSRTYSAAQLAAGVNLAADFPENPFSEPFAKVDQAVAAKQAYETRQIKTLFHGEEGRVNLPATVALTEQVRKKFADAIPTPLPPVRHTLKIEGL
jgi:lysophospholipase L1-like esterase